MLRYREKIEAFAYKNYRAMDKERRLRGKRPLRKNTEQSEDSKESEGKKTYTCPYKGCSKTFTESGNLKTHIRIHVNFLHHFSDWRTAIYLQLRGLWQELHY